MCSIFLSHAVFIKCTYIAYSWFSNQAHGQLLKKRDTTIVQGNEKTGK